MSIEDAPPVTEDEMMELRLICVAISALIETGHAIGHTAQGNRRVVKRADEFAKYVLTGEIPVL